MSVPVARRNLWHERGKLILSVLGVAASLTLIVLLMGFRNGMFVAVTAYMDNMDADLIVAQSGAQGRFAASTIPAAIHESLSSLSGAVETEHTLVTDIIFTYDGMKMPAVLVGFNTETGIGGPWSLSEGQNVQNDGEIVLDTWLARRAGLGVGDAVDVLGRTYRVTGLSRGTSSWLGAYLFISRRDAEEVLQLAGIASFYLLRLPLEADVTAVKEAIEQQVAGVEVLTPAERAALDWKLLGTVLNMPINLMILIGVVTGTAVMGLTAYAAIVDRMREYGVLKAVGANGSWLRRLVITETLYRAGLGFVLGAGLSYLTAELIMFLFPQFTITILPETVAFTGLLAVAMTVLAALLPIRQIILIDPAVVFKA
jgi:putative ABC transport system permease protein